MKGGVRSPCSQGFFTIHRAFWTAILRIASGRSVAVMGVRAYSSYLLEKELFREGLP